MKILVTGSSEGIGKAIANKFINEGHNVIGIDLNESAINNAGVQNSGNDIDINLKGTI